MADQGTKTVRVPTLVKAEDVHMWLTRFMAFAVVERIAQACQMKQDPDLPANEDDHIDESSARGKKQAVAKKANEKAFACLTMAMGEKRFFGLLYEAKTTEWPSGLAWKFLQLLRERYMPQDKIARNMSLKVPPLGSKRGPFQPVSNNKENNSSSGKKPRLDQQNISKPREDSDEQNDCTLREGVEELFRARDELKRENTGLRSINKDCMEAVKYMEEDLSQKSSAKSRRHQELIEEATKARSVFETGKTKIEELQRELGVSSGSNEEIQQKLRGILETGKTKFEELLGELGASSGSNGEIQQKLCGILETAKTNIEELLGELGLYSCSWEDLREKVKKLRTLSSKINRLEKEIETFKIERQEVTDQRVKIADLEETLATLKESDKDSKQKIADLEETNADLEKRDKDSEQKIVQLSTEKAVDAVTLAASSSPPPAWLLTIRKKAVTAVLTGSYAPPRVVLVDKDDDAERASMRLFAIIFRRAAAAARCRERSSAPKLLMPVLGETLPRWSVIAADE